MGPYEPNNAYMNWSDYAIVSITWVLQITTSFVNNGH